MNELDRIRRLEDELDAARRTILDLMPDDLRQILTDYIARSSDGSVKCHEDMLDAVVDKAIPVPNPNPDYFDDKAPCPLCRLVGEQHRSVGYKLPEGLRRHLTGWGHVQQCSVMHAVEELAFDRVRRTAART